MDNFEIVTDNTLRETTAHGTAGQRIFLLSTPLMISKNLINSA